MVVANRLGQTNAILGAHQDMEATRATVQEDGITDGQVSSPVLPPSAAAGRHPAHTPEVLPAHSPEVVPAHSPEVYLTIRESNLNRCLSANHHRGLRCISASLKKQTIVEL